MMTVQDKEEEHHHRQEEEEGEGEVFYESNDHIISASSSDTDDNEINIWISEPSSIKERRISLLQKIGLASDPHLSRIKEDEQENPQSEVKRSISYNGTSNTHSNVVIVPRSRSDTSINPNNKNISSNIPPTNSKPPRACRHKSSPGINYFDGDIEVQKRTIKNLDTGKEFVINEDFKAVKEVGTRRHLSMEEFDMCVIGTSPIVQELMRRQKNKVDLGDEDNSSSSSNSSASRSRKKGGWFSMRKKESDEASVSNEGPRRTKVRQYGKPRKELTGLFMSQEINGHDGSIWSVKFSCDGKYLASAGEDCVVRVWEVSENDEKKGEVSRNSSFSVGLMDPVVALACIDDREMSHWEKKGRARLGGRRRSSSSVEQLMVPEYVFALSEKAICCFKGHLDDVLDLSWSKSQHLLSSSMDKTVRLWHLSSNSCLKVFTHSDYVTCIQFNPSNENYFISGSLDEKVRLWNIPDRQVVDWDDLHEMITAVCFKPDGKSAFVGSHKGNCYLYETSESKLLERKKIGLQSKKKKSSLKKITGFQFSAGSSTDVIITSADSRIRVVNGVDVVHKFKGFRNTSSQIAAHSTANGKYLISASEDSHVYIWRYEASDSRTDRNKSSSTSSTQCYEQFYCEDVTVALPWPVTNTAGALQRQDDVSWFSDKVGATWPEEKLVCGNSPGMNNGGVVVQSRPAWGMVIVTAGRGGSCTGRAHALSIFHDKVADGIGFLKRVHVTGIVLRVLFIYFLLLIFQLIYTDARTNYVSYVAL